MEYSWKDCSIGELGRVITGKTPSTKESSLWNGNIPFVTPKDIQGIKRINHTERFVTVKGMNCVKGAILPPNAVCVSCIGNIGYTGMTKTLCITNQQINSVIVNKDNDPDFVFYLFRSLWSFFKHYEGQSTTLSILNKQQFSNIRVPILAAFDNKIETNQQINDNLLQQAQSIFTQEFLTLNRLPNGWQESSLLGIADYLNGLAMQKYRPTGEEYGLPVLKIKELRQGFCDSNSELCSPSIKPEYIVHDGDVIFSWSGSLLVDFWCGGTCGLNQHLFKVTSSKYDKWFYYAWTNHHLDKFAAIAAGMATTMGHIKREELAKAEVLIPSKSDYDRIGGLLSPLYDLVIANRIENRKLAALRDELLPRLMSGQIDVSEVSL